MKNPKPSQRENKRYLRFRVHAEKEAELGEVVDAVWRSSLNYLGTQGTAELNFWVVGNKFNKEKQEGVIKVRKDREKDLRAALCLINEIGDRSGFISVEESSGTIDSLSSI